MTTTATKLTKRDRFNTILTLIAAAADAGWEGYDFEDLTDFANREIASLDKKSAKAKEAAAAKKNEKDELCAVVESVLTDDWQTREQVTAQIEGEDISVAKVGYRLTKLCALGIAEKTEANVAAEGEKARKVVVYRLATAEATE